MSKKLFLVAITAFTLTACNTPTPLTDAQPPHQVDEKPLASESQTYTASDYQFQYPKNYTIEEPTESFKVLTVRGPQGRVEIFKMSDFGDRPFGFSGEETPEETDTYAPKQTIEATTENPYDIWLFWPQDNSKVEAEIKQIAESFEVK